MTERCRTIDDLGDRIDPELIRQLVEGESRGLARCWCGFDQDAHDLGEPGQSDEVITTHSIDYSGTRHLDFLLGVGMPALDHLHVPETKTFCVRCALGDRLWALTGDGTNGLLDRFPAEGARDD